MDVSRIKNSANFVQGNPSPGEFDIGSVALLDDASNGDEFATRSGDGEGWFLRVSGGDETLKSIYAGGRERDIPARRRSQSRGQGALVEEIQP